MGPVERKIRQYITGGMTLKTVPDGAESKVASLSADALVLLFGKKEARTAFNWEDLETIPGFLTDKGWVKIGARHVTTGVPGTLDGYLKGFVKRTSGGYITSVLEIAGIVDANRAKPAKVRLRNDWSK